MVIDYVQRKRKGGEEARITFVFYVEKLGGRMVDPPADVGSTEEVQVF